MRKKCLVLTSCLILAFVTGCGSSGAISKSDDPVTIVQIDGKNDSDLTGLTYLYDYGDNARLYADNFTKIVYIVYYDESGTGAKATKAVSMSPWISENGNYCYVDTDNRIIKELTDEKDTDSDSMDDKDSDDSTSTKQNNLSSSEETNSSGLDSSITDKINQNQN